MIDTNKDGVTDTIIYDTERNGKWAYSLHDTDFDKKWDLVCEHETGNIKPTRCEPYKPKNN